MNSDPQRPSPPARMLGAIAALASALLTACGPAHRTQVVSSVVEAYPEPAQENDFYDELARRSIVSNEDALHALYLFSGAEEPAGWEARLARAQDLGWIDLRFTRPARESMPAAVFAGALARVINLKGGLTYTITGGWNTAANRELRALGILPTLSDDQTITGPQLLSTLRKAEMYQAAHQPPASQPARPEPLGEAQHTPPATPESAPK